MSPQPGTSVSGSLVAVLLLSCWFGAAPVYMRKKDGTWFVGYSAYNRLYGQLLTGVLVTVNITGLIIDLTLRDQLKLRTKSSMDSLVWTLDILFVTTTMSLGVYLGPRRVRQMIQALHCIDKINLDVKNSLNLSTKKHVKFIVYYLISLVLLLLYDFGRVHLIALQENRQWRINCIYSSFYIMYFCTFLIEMQFALVAISVKTPLKSINKVLLDVLYTVESKTGAGDCCPVITINKLVDSFTFGNDFTNSEDPKNPDSVFITIRRLQRHHGSLCDIIQNLNDANGPILSILVASFILHLVMSPYYLVSELSDTYKTMRGVWLHCAWCIFHTTSMFVLIEPCHQTTEEIRKTKQLLSQLMRKLSSTSDPLYKQLDMFYRQLMMTCTEYVPLGVCTLNRPLIATIMSGVTTYLVVLIQFDKLSN